MLVVVALFAYFFSAHAGSTITERMREGVRKRGQCGKGGGWTIAASERAGSIVGALPSSSDNPFGCILAFGQIRLCLSVCIRMICMLVRPVSTIDIEPLEKSRNNDGA
jgi:hypothetical protein